MTTVGLVNQALESGRISHDDADTLMYHVSRSNFSPTIASSGGDSGGGVWFELR